MLAKNSEKFGRKMVRRLYGESLTSDECLARLQEEKPKTSRLKRQNKGKGKGKAKAKVQKIDTDEIENEPPFESDSTLDDLDNDHDWLPLQERRDRNVFEMSF